MVTKKHLVYVVLALVVILGIQTYYIQHIQEEYISEKLSKSLNEYKDNQAKRDSLIIGKLTEISSSDFKIKEHFYHTKEVVKKDEEQLQSESDDRLSIILDSLINERKRSSEFRSRKSD